MPTSARSTNTWGCCPPRSSARRRIGTRRTSAMLLSYSTWGMPTVPIDVAVSHCATLGFDGLELTVIPGWITDAADLGAAERRRIRELYDDHNLDLCGLCANTPLLADDAS